MSRESGRRPWQARRRWPAGDCGALSPRLVIPGGYQPTFGPDHPAHPTDPPTPGPAPGGGWPGHGTPGGGWPGHGTPGGGTTVVRSSPRLSSLTAALGDAHRLVVRFRLSAPATVGLRLVRVVRSGRRIRLVPVSGTGVIRARGGTNLTRLRPRLRRGIYRLTVVATDSTGHRSAPIALTIRVR
jgi:hypothetical protein